MPILEQEPLHCSLWESQDKKAKCSIGFLLVMLDGPTSVFVAGNLGGDLSIPFILTGVEVLVITLICYLKRKH